MKNIDLFFVLVFFQTKSLPSEQCQGGWINCFVFRLKATISHTSTPHKKGNEWKIWKTCTPCNPISFEMCFECSFFFARFFTLQLQLHLWLTGWDHDGWRKKEIKLFLHCSILLRFFISEKCIGLFVYWMAMMATTRSETTKEYREEKAMLCNVFVILCF